MERFYNKCERYWRINFENRFNFQEFNTAMLKERTGECVLAFDPSYISKSGKATYGLGSYWSGCAQAVKRGLELCGFAVVDQNLHTAFHLNAIQTPESKGVNLLHYYCRIVKENYIYFKEFTNCLVADSYFAKSEAVETITTVGMHFISRLGNDAVLFYLYKGEKTGNKGAPRKYTGKVDKEALDLEYFTLCHDSAELKIYNAIVYCKAFRRNINLSVCCFYKNGKQVTRKLYFSTDLKMDGMKIVSYYHRAFKSSSFIGMPNSIVDWKTVRHEAKISSTSILMLLFRLSI
jgi:hypothetical protein